MKKINILFLAIMLLGSAGCSSDFLETEPSDKISLDQASQSVDGLKTILEGMHNMMYLYTFGHFFGNGEASLNAQIDMLGDDMINTKPAFFMGVYRWEEHRDPYGSINYKAWDFYYTVIQHANAVLQGVQKLDVSEEDKALIAGEAQLFRAYCYAKLVQLFGKRYVKGEDNNSLGVILRLEPNYDPMARSSVAQCYDQINKDLSEGLAYLSKASTVRKKNWINYNTACGIASRIALAQSDWTKAETYADWAITKSASMGIALQQGQKLCDGFNDYGASEWMWGYHQAADQNIYFHGFNANYSYNFAGYNKSLRYAINRGLYDKMGQKDARRNWWVCLDQGDKIPEDAYSGYFEGGMTRPNWEITGQCIKFKSINNKTTVGDNVLMRLSEMYYNKAEAQARQGKFEEAIQTLHTVMITRDPEYDASNLSGDELIEEIFRNKRLDFYMEGLRFYDMKRLGIVPDRLHAANANYLKGKDLEQLISRNSGENAKSIAKTEDAKEWQFVIPYDEIKGNNLCEQNEL
ncbi:RagB/SusD family nutrient uptake outer membrane protein [Phocaeicola abscessus]|uniref:RagB/SusD family nutrient uptake outer membrane protein n=1 Tax=Phocaeicola abscessus TaxID=555313 RepID=UPI000386BABA|nr:RagB/SusD family nutrient uptake outer membrane protein [Phocaeicola abscessus]EPT33641.1 starch-binding protein, SusD-like family [Bacteroidetes bacterium oral taxon 272 str. F0290]